MPESLAPATAEELRDALRGCGEEQASIETGGGFSKRLAGGPIADARYRLGTSRLNRVLAYEPADLTVSVEAGMRFAELARILEQGNQFLPLDPPFAEQATVGGVLATNSSGYRRRRYGTARDMVIGMRFATLDGKLVSSGGMVVKNVTGLDMGKLMIGSFGTLAVIASVNFKVFPKPEAAASFQFRSRSIGTLLDVRREILGGMLQPVAIDWLDSGAAESVGLTGMHSLLIEASGTPAVTRRFSEAFAGLAAKASVQFATLEPGAWTDVRECGPRWLDTHVEGAVIRVSTVHSRLGELLEIIQHSGCATLLRAGNAAGIVLAPDRETASRALDALRLRGIHGRLEAASDEVKRDLRQWDARGSELDLMQRIKADFDPLLLLNRGRLYGVI
jgi:glycolate oxidase FAD binding subunit